MGAFATRDIPAATNIFVEHPLMTIYPSGFQVSEFEVLRAYEQLSSADKQLFDQARHDPDHGPRCKCKVGIAQKNNFSEQGECIHLDVYQRRHLLTCERSLVDGPMTVYPIGSKFNHSCRPNVIMLTPLKGVYHTFRTIKDVNKGEELTFSYLHDIELMTTEERQKLFQKESTAFACTCEHCSLPAHQSLVSDMRRCILRYLFYWLRNKDVRHFGFQSPKVLRSVANPKLLSNGVYSLLYAILLEAEGIVNTPDSHLAYALTAWHVLNVAHHKKLDRIRPSTVQDIRMWMQKSKSNLRIQYGEAKEEAGEMWMGIELATDPGCVVDDGTLQWEALYLVEKLVARKFRIRLFTMAPP